MLRLTVDWLTTVCMCTVTAGCVTSCPSSNGESQLMHTTIYRDLLAAMFKRIYNISPYDPEYLQLQYSQVSFSTFCFCIHHVYLRDLCILVFLQLLLEAIVWTDNGANSHDSSQALLPVVVGHGHQVGHNNGGAA